MRPARDFKEVVRPGHYFMMGDNRDNSSDSRVWGQVPETDIVGKAFAIWMHWEKEKALAKVVEKWRVNRLRGTTKDRARVNQAWGTMTGATIADPNSI